MTPELGNSCAAAMSSSDAVTVSLLSIAANNQHCLYPAHTTQFLLRTPHISPSNKSSLELAIANQSYCCRSADPRHVQQRGARPAAPLPHHHRRAEHLQHPAHPAQAHRSVHWSPARYNDTLMLKTAIYWIKCILADACTCL